MSEILKEMTMLSSKVKALAEAHQSQRDTVIEALEEALDCLKRSSHINARDKYTTDNKQGDLLASEAIDNAKQHLDALLA